MLMLAELKRKDHDVVYGHYIDKQHSWFRKAERLQRSDGYDEASQTERSLSRNQSISNRVAVNEIVKYRGPFPYIDGLIYRTTRNVGQIAVEHRANISGPSRYTFRKLVRLWLNMFLNFSIKPLRLSVYVGLFVACLSIWH